MGNVSGKYIRGLWNSSRISIRPLVGNAAAADCRIPVEFWLDIAKSGDCVQFQSQF